MRISAPIYRLKRDARALARQGGIALSEALDRVARREGFQGWSHLSARAGQNPARRLLRTLSPADLVLLAARPGQGKTLLATELAALTAAAGSRAFIFSLEETTGTITQRLAGLGRPYPDLKEKLVLDTSDEICADHIVRRLTDDAPALAVVDYLQLLDQRRSTPPLAEQILTLKDHAVRSGTVFMLISQIDRAFETSARSMPVLSDIRLPNPVDLGVFSKTCFLHEGTLQIHMAGQRSA